MADYCLLHAPLTNQGDKFWGLWGEVGGDKPLELVFGAFELCGGSFPRGHSSEFINQVGLNCGIWLFI